MQENHSAIERHKLAVAALGKNLAHVSTVAESLLLGFQAIESTHLLQKWFQDQVTSLETMLRQTGLDASISEAMPTDPFAALSQGNTVKDLTDTFHGALERLEQINCTLREWADEFAKEGERMELLRKDLQHKVLSAQGDVLEIVQNKRSSPDTSEKSPKKERTIAPRSFAEPHPASAWAEAANVEIPPTPAQPHGKTTPVRPDSLGTAQVPTAKPPIQEKEPAVSADAAPTYEAKSETIDAQEASADADDSNRSPRVAIEVPVSVESATRLWFATSENCSETGVFVATPFVVPTGTRVTLELLFPGAEPMPVYGEVAWTRDAQNESGNSGMGIKLVDISEELETRLKQLLPTDQSSD